MHRFGRGYNVPFGGARPLNALAGWVFALALIAAGHVAFAPDSRADVVTNPAITVLAEHGGVVTQIAADADFVYAALGSRVLVYRAEHGANEAPVVVSAPTGRMIDRLAVTGDGLLLATTSEGHPDGGRLLVYRGARAGEAADVAPPELVGELRLPRTAVLGLGGLVAAPGAAWFAADAQLHSVDLSRPERPRVVGRAEAPQRVAHLVRSGTKLLAAVLPASRPPPPTPGPPPTRGPGRPGLPTSTPPPPSWELLAYDLGAGDAPLPLSAVDLPITVTGLAAGERGANAEAFALAINHEQGGLAVVALDERGQLSLRAHVSADEGLPMLRDIAPTGPALAVRGDVAWMVRRDVSGAWVLHAIELGGSEPRAIGAVPTTVNWPAGLVLGSDGDQLHLALGEQGVLRAELEGRAELGARTVGWAPTGRFGDITVDEGGGVWGVSSHGERMDLVRVARPEGDGGEAPSAGGAAPTPRVLTELSAVRGLAMAGPGRLVVVDAGQVLAWDVRDLLRPLGPTEIEPGESPLVFPRLLHADGDWLLFEEVGIVRAERLDGGRIATTVRSLATTGSRARLAGRHMWEVVPEGRVRNGVLRAIDLGVEPPAPRPPGLSIGGRLASDRVLLAATPRLVVLADTRVASPGIELLAVDDPARPRLAGLLELPGAPEMAAVDGANLWLEQGDGADGRLSLIDLRLPSLPDELGAIELGRRAVRLEAAGGVAWLTTNGGVLVGLAVSGGGGGPVARPSPSPSPSVTPITPPIRGVGRVVLPWLARP